MNTEELDSITANIYADPMHYEDPQCLPDLLKKAITEVGAVAVDPQHPAAAWAADLLRALELRAVSGIPFGEPREPRYLETLDEYERTGR